MKENVIIFCCLSLLLTACIKSNSIEKSVKMQEINIIDTPLFNAYPQYLVLSEEYSRLFEDNKLHSNVIGLIRKGEVLQLIETAGIDTFGYGWYYVIASNRKGWIQTYNPYMFFIADQAQYYSQFLLQKDIDAEASIE